MQTFNTYYSSLEDLELFLKEKKIQNSEKLLCQVFTSQNNQNSISKILIAINSLLPDCKVLGTTTDGEIMDGNVSSFKTVLSFTIFDSTSIETIILPANNDYLEAGKKVGKYLNKENLKLIISFIDGLHGNGEDYLKGISSVNESFKIAGGMAGDNSKFQKTFVFDNTQVLENGVVAIGLFSQNLHVHTNYSFDWVPVGRKLTITKSNKNVVYEIDNKSAYDTYKYYLGEEIAQKLPDVGIEFPLVIEKDGMTIARAILGRNKDNSLIFGGNFAQNEQVRFAYGYNDAIFTKAQNSFERLKEVPAETIFIYSCMARKRFLQDSIELETKPYNNIAPTSGFFTYGEFFTNDTPKFLNQTLTKVVLSESGFISEREKEQRDKKGSNRSTLTALTHLINVTTSELDKQKEELKEANKAKDDFLANMSHELKTPLNSINVISSVMHKNKDGMLDEKKLKNIEVINKSGRFLLSLINDILDISKLEAGEIKASYDKIDIIEILDDIFHMFEPQMHKKEIIFNFNHDNEVFFIYSDEGKIKQIVKNLLSNSVKFTNDEGCVNLNFIEKENHIEIEIKDNGIGIPKEKLENIFDRFKQVDESTNKKYGGTGLGLSITKELLKVLEGSISVESELNVGTTFKVTLPKNLNKEENKELITLNTKKDTSKKILIYNTCTMNFFKLVVDLKKDFEITQVYKFEEIKPQNLINFDYLILDGQTIDKKELETLIMEYKDKLILLEKEVLESLYVNRVKTINSNDLELLKTTLAGEIVE